MAGTVKVRIAVAVAEDGSWNAVGNSNWDDADAAVESEHIHGEALYSITAEVEVPDAIETPGIAGTVEAAA